MKCKHFYDPLNIDIAEIWNAKVLNDYRNVVSGCSQSDELNVDIHCDLWVSRSTWQSCSSPEPAQALLLAARAEQPAISALRYATRFALEINSSSECLGLLRRRVCKCQLAEQKLESKVCSYDSDDVTMFLYFRIKEGKFYLFTCKNCCVI